MISYWLGILKIRVDYVKNWLVMYIYMFCICKVFFKMKYRKNSRCRGSWLDGDRGGGII